jgi:ELWxxDGT repeat protein
MVKDIRPGESGSGPYELFSVGDTLFFEADDGVNGDELWKSDGTEAGTVMVKNIRIGGDSSNPAEFAQVGNTLFFEADDGDHGKELWKSDGTEAGTVMVKDITGVGGSSLGDLTAVGSLLYFRERDQLWKSDGTEDGTEMVRAFSNLYELEPAGNVLFLIADDGSGVGEELWKSDGTEAGTSLVKDIYVGEEDSDIYNMTNVDGSVIFSADDGIHGDELWKSDGSLEGTSLVKDINPGESNGWPYGFTEVNGVGYFIAEDGNHDMELWRTDGTSEGTVMISGDVNPYGSSDVRYIETRYNYTEEAVVAAGSTLFFVADSRAHGTELWSFNPDYVPFEPLTPDRLLDTRPMADKVGTLAIAGGATPYELQVTGVGDIPSSGVGAVSLNVTAVNTEANEYGGFLTVYPCGDIPDSSNLNFVTGQTVANSVITPVSADGKVCFYVYGKADLLVDTSGYLPPGFVPMTPDRLLDTRAGDMVGKLDGSGSAYELQVTGVGDIPSSGVGAVAMNVTAVSTEANNFGGFVTVYPCGDVPDSSNLNFVSGQTIPNSVIAPVSADGKVCFYVYGKAHLLADVSGYFPTGFVPLTPDRLLDTRPTDDTVGTLATAGGATPYELQVTGVGDIPSSGVGAVAMNVTAVSTEANDFGGFVTVYPCGDVPDSSNLNFVSGQTIPNSVIAPVSADGKVCFYVYGKGTSACRRIRLLPRSELTQRPWATVDILLSRSGRPHRQVRTFGMPKPLLRNVAIASLACVVAVSACQPRQPQGAESSGLTEVSDESFTGSAETSEVVSTTEDLTPTAPQSTTTTGRHLAAVPSTAVETTLTDVQTTTIPTLLATPTEEEVVTTSSVAETSSTVASTSSTTPQTTSTVATTSSTLATTTSTAVSVSTMPASTTTSSPAAVVTTTTAPESTTTTAPVVVAPTTSVPMSSSYYSIDISGFSFAPSALTVQVGDTVTWTNLDSATHTVTFNGSPSLSSGGLQEGDTHLVIFDSVGTYAYGCSPHASMQGTITVTN